RDVAEYDEDQQHQRQSEESSHSASFVRHSRVQAPAARATRVCARRRVTAMTALRRVCMRVCLSRRRAEQGSGGTAHASTGTSPLTVPRGKTTRRYCMWPGLSVHFLRKMLQSCEIRREGGIRADRFPVTTGLYPLVLKVGKNLPYRVANSARMPTLFVAPRPSIYPDHLYSE